MKIVVIGTRGIPLIPGGVETHCEELYPRIAAMGHDVTVIRRSCYVTDNNRVDNYRGVKLVDVYAPRKKSLEAIVHTFLAVIKALRLHADVLHVHAIGPSLMVPFARLLGLRVVSTNHGPDYDRGKWGKLAKTFLKTGERMGAKYSNAVIVISTVIADILKTKYGRTDTRLIYNGVNAPVKSKNTDYIESLGLTPGRYVVAVGRFVEEKGFHDLVNAWTKLGLSDYKLAIAGDSDHPDQYSENLKQMARQAGVVLTGYIKGEKMNQFMTNASLFVLPSYHEGLPIALLEAMSYNLDVIVSDIPANTIRELSSDDFFAVGNVDDLAQTLQRKLAAPATPRQYDLSAYDWNNIAEQTEALYNEIRKKKK
jgi:glycosyltransferase involved in cell wall biosynthesis